MSPDKGKIEIVHDPESGDMQVNSNLDPASIVSLLEIAKYRLMKQNIGENQ